MKLENICVPYWPHNAWQFAQAVGGMRKARECFALLRGEGKPYLQIPAVFDDDHILRKVLSAEQCERLSRRFRWHNADGRHRFHIPAELALSPKQADVVEVKFHNPSATQTQIAKFVGCSLATVNKLLRLSA